MPCQHPGKVLLQQYLEPQQLSQNRLARAIKVPPRRINEIIHEKRAITADTAVRLALYFGNSPGYWMHLQSVFDIEKVKHNISIQLNAIQTPAETDYENRQTDDIEAVSKNGTNPDTTKPATNIKKRMMR